METVSEELYLMDEPTYDADDPFWWKHAERWLGFRLIATSFTEQDGFESLMQHCLDYCFFHRDGEAMRLFLESVGLIAPPKLHIVRQPEPKVARLPKPTLVVGAGVAHFVDESDLPRRHWSRNKEAKNRWMFNGALIKHPVSR